LNAEVLPASMFGDHMVLQRDMPVPVWGRAAPGEKVTVRFAEQVVSGEADNSGYWKVTLSPLKASADGREMTIEADNTVTYRDVLVGEVWVCSGQSNMQYGWGTNSIPMFNWGGDTNLASLAPDAATKPIRSFTVPVNVSFTPSDNCSGSWSTGVSGSAVAFGFSYYLHEALQVPVAVIVSCWGSSSIEGWMPLDMTEELPHFKKIMEDFHSSSNAQERVRSAMAKGIRHGMVFVRKQPNLLYNAMLHPVIPYACRGMVWYQGEANASAPEEYGQSLPLWLKRLRKGWEKEDFNLIVVMLPGYGTDDGSPDSKSWAWFRYVQMKILNLPHTAVANTIDLGDTKNIHPPDKTQICERLALLARRSIHGENIMGQGPTFSGLKLDGSTMTVQFEHAEGLRTVDETPPKGFWVAEKPGEWHPAEASIVGDTVLLHCQAVASPKACRYAFSGKPDVNLVNKDGLPAYPFRTDEWKRPE